MESAISVFWLSPSASGRGTFLKVMLASNCVMSEQSDIIHWLNISGVNTGVSAMAQRA